MPKISRAKIWVSVGIRYSLWLLLQKSAEKNKRSIAKELETILCKELEVLEP